MEVDMCYFDSPIARCEAVHMMVLTDETQAECAREHGCPRGRICPLCGYFAKKSGMAETNIRVEKSHHQARHSARPAVTAIAHV